jgi:hypothetical protein
MEIYQQMVGIWVNEEEELELVFAHDEHYGKLVCINMMYILESKLTPP